MKMHTFDEACRFIIALGKAGHGYGVSSHRLESYLVRVCRALSLHGEFMVTPSYINFIFWQESDERQHSHFARMPSSTFDMAKLARVGELVDQVESGTLSVTEGVTRLKSIGSQSPYYGRLPVALGYLIVGAGFAVILSASWGDVFLSGLLSLVVYAVVLLAARSDWVAHTLELSAAFVTSVLANTVAFFMPGSDAFIVTLCALIVLIPGLALSLGLAEISAKDVISGTSRLTDGIIITLKLFIAAYIGTALVNALSTVPAAVTPPAIPAVWTWLFVISLVAGLAVIFQVLPRDFGWTMLGGVLAYAGVVFGSRFGFWQGSFVGALTLGLYANLYAWRLRRPTSTVMLTAAMVLVPGAAAYRGLHTGVTGGLVSGLGAEWHVLVNMFAILAGFVVAYSLVPPKSTL
jgi:uncharacterized membrane protein YjjP (DUF1212 family)